jgi:hypothetical protein
MSNEVIKFQLKPLLSAMKAYYVVFSLDLGREEPETFTKITHAIGTLCERLSDLVRKKKIDLTEDPYRLYFSSPKDEEKEYFTFAPHISIGHSPFLLNKDNGALEGVFIKLRHTRFVFCSKYINTLARKLFDLHTINEDPISFKQAKTTILERMNEENNPDSIPLLTKVSDIFVYLDVETGRVLAKSNHRTKDAMRAFFELSTRVSETIQERHPETAPTLAPLTEMANSERLYTQPYTNHQMTLTKAVGAYNISSLVEYYAKQSETKDDLECPVEPTTTAELRSRDVTTQTMKFKNSVDLFMSDKKKSSFFIMLQDFSVEKELIFNSIRVNGELDKPSLLERYGETHPEALGTLCEEGTVGLTYDTKAVEGNIAFKIVDTLSIYNDAVRALLSDEMGDRFYNITDMEKLLAKEFASLLPILHHSADLFTSLYLSSNQPPEKFGAQLNEVLQEA